MLVNLRDWEAAAHQAMTVAARDYIVDAAMDGRTLADNEAAFARRRLRPHVLTGAGDPDLGTEVFGRRWATPLLIAPTARHTMLTDDGEVATARAATARDVTMTVSTSAARDLGDIVAALDGPWWYQVYLLADPGHRRAHVEAAVDAGAEALVLTVDLAVSGRREEPLRAGRAAFPTTFAPSHVAAAAGVPPEEVTVEYHEPLTPDDVSWLADFGLPVVAKGVLRGDDARRAVDAGAAAIQVSNHGGRQLDGAVASLDALEDVVAAVGDDVPVLLDGGIRRGSDVVVALALGAAAVGIGKPVLWGLAVDGQSGVEAVLDLLRNELDHVLRLVGVDHLAAVTRDLVTP